MVEDSPKDRLRSPLRAAGVYRARPIEDVLSTLAGADISVALDLRSGPTITGVVESVANGTACLVDPRGSLIYVRVDAADALTVIDTRAAQARLVAPPP